MKTKYKIVASLCLITSVLVACIDEWSVWTNSYVLSYESMNGIEGKYYDGGDYKIISITGISRGFIGSVESTDRTEKEAFLAVCEKYGDTYYNRKLKTAVGHEMYYRNYFAEDFSSIRITSRSDFDDEHPAGTSLNDLFHFVSTSPYRYIQRGYTDEFDWENKPGLSLIYNNTKRNFFSSIDDYKYNPADPIDKRVDELVPDDLKLLGIPFYNVSCYLVCFAKPTLDKEHEFLIVFYGDNNNNLTTRVTVQF